MNTLRRVGLVVVSCIILLLALLCPVSAAMVLEDDFIEESFNNGLMMTPNGTLAAAYTLEPNYPSFSPNDIPWRDAPQEVQEIILSDCADMNKSGNPLGFDEPAKVPFVCVRVNGSNALVYVGYNLSVLYLDSNNRPVLGKYYFNGYDPSDSIMREFYPTKLYRATYNLSTKELTVPWYDATSDCTRIDNYDILTYAYTYTTALSTPTGKYDLYFYGANYFFRDYSEFSSSEGYCALGPLNNNNLNVYISYSFPLGFKAGTNYFYNRSDFVNTYCQYFVPTIYPDINSGVVDDFSSAEDKLVNSYNPDDLSSDINISIDSNAWGAVFNIFNMFITGNSVLVTLIITMLSLGFVALLLNR